MTRLEKLIGQLPGNAGAAIITDEHNRFYLTGLRSSAGTLLLTRAGASLIVDSRYHELALKSAVGYRVILQDEICEQIARMLRAEGITSLAVEAASCTLQTLSIYRWKLEGITLIEEGELSRILVGMRSRKDEGEINEIRAAQQLTERTFEHLLGFIKPGMSEREIALEAEFFGRRAGAEGTSFAFIVAAGKNSSLPHAVPGEYKIQHGDFVLIDMGFKTRGYCADMTRTVAVGTPTNRQRKVYETVLSAQEMALGKIKPGIPCSEIDSTAREFIDSSGYKGLFGHGLGHSVGLQVHELPAFSKGCKTAIAPGMVLTVEPGIYLPGEFGVRIEDMVAITANGHENLTRSPKNLIIL